MSENTCEIAVLGGSGLYEFPGLTDVTEYALATPFGPPSDALRVGTVDGRRVAFLARHGRGHRLAPAEIPHRANIYALKSLGVRWILGASAVGSLREELPPGTFVFPDQFYDRTKRPAEEHTFFHGQGIVAHIAFGHPVCALLQRVFFEAAVAEGAPAVAGGTYVNMEGPAFSTRAESLSYRAAGLSVIGMTNLAEAKLAREAEIAYAPLAMVTDFDAWREEGVVDVAAIVAQLHGNAALAVKVLRRAIGAVPLGATSGAHEALTAAILTPRSAWPEPSLARLRPLLARVAGLDDA